MSPINYGSTKSPITVNGTRAVVTALMDDLMEVRI